MGVEGLLACELQTCWWVGVQLNSLCLPLAAVPDSWWLGAACSRILAASPSAASRGPAALPFQSVFKQLQQPQLCEQRLAGVAANGSPTQEAAVLNFQQPVLALTARPCAANCKLPQVWRTTAAPHGLPAPRPSSHALAGKAANAFSCATELAGVEDNGSLTRVAAFPIGIDPDRFTEALEMPEVKANIAQLLNR